MRDCDEARGRVHAWEPAATPRAQTVTRERGFFAPSLVHALRRGRPGRLATLMAQKVWSYRVWSMLRCEVWARLFLDRTVVEPPAGLSHLM